MDAVEVRMRCIEAAAKNPTPHKDGFAAAVAEQALAWSAWVLTGAVATKSPSTLGLPKK